MNNGIWILERCVDQRFPYRLQILKGEEPWLVLQTQDRWPASGKNIFCLREEEPPAQEEIVGEIERVPVRAIHQRGRRCLVVLDRKRYKRCDFLFLTKTYKRSPHKSYEQIYWLTQRSIQQRRPAYKSPSLSSAAGLTVCIDSRERYPWRFPEAQTEKRSLPVGDYALMDGEDMLAVAERKTFDNLLADFGVMPVLHQRLVELATYDNHTLVIEAPYADFLNPKKVHHYSPSFCARAIGELYALHPNLRVVFCANRKIANEWTRQYFAAVWNLKQSRQK